MRATASEKLEILRLVEGSQLPVSRTLRELDVPRSTFYTWHRAYEEGGYDALEAKEPARRSFWNRIPDAERAQVVEEALARPELSPRELAWQITDSRGSFISESSVYRILKSYDLVASPAYVLVTARDRLDRPTRRVNELWQTDFSYFKVVGWGWYYLLSVLDDYSRYIVSWKLFTGMAAGDLQELLEEAIAAAGVDGIEVLHRLRLLSDNGSAFVSKALREYLEARGLAHTRGKPYHPMTQGKIERFHRTLKNVVTLKNFTLPWELERDLAELVLYYNHERVHEALGNQATSLHQTSFRSRTSQTHA